MKKLFTIVMLGLSLGMTSQSNDRLKDYDLYEIMEVIKLVESRGKPDAIGNGGIHLGILQISKICVIEINRHYNTTYKHKDVFNIDVAEDIFIKTLERGATLFRNKYKREPTEEQLVRMWNGGLYAGYKNPNTKKYYNEFLKHKQKLNSN